MRDRLLILLLIGTIASGCSDGTGSNSVAGKTISNPIIGVEAVVVQPRSLENRIWTTGTVLANEEVELKSEVSGRVTAIRFDEGSRITRGLIMVKLDDSELKAQLKKLSVQEEYAKHDSSRQAQLMEVSATTQEVYDMAMSRLKTIQADKEVVMVQIDKTEIRAPFNGILGLRNISQGSYITPATIITDIQEIDPIKLEFKIPEKYANYIKPGMVVSFTVASSTQNFKAQVYAVEPKIDFNTRTVTVRAKSSNLGYELFPGGFADIAITLEKMDQALVVPSNAVVPDLNGQIIFIYRNGKVRQVGVEIGVRTERTIQITEGLNPMDTVIVTGLLQVKDGLPVQIKTINDIPFDNQ